MAEQDPDETGMWRYPAAENSWFTPSRRIPRPDARVWPPLQVEPQAGSTVPIPVIQGGPPAPRRVWPPPAGPERAAAASPEPRTPVSPGVSGPAETPAGDPSRPVPAAPPADRRRRRLAARIGLQLVGAAGLTAAVLGVKGYDAISRYEAADPPAQVRHVAQGRSAPLGNATWRLAGIALAPAHSPDTGDRAMLRIEVEVTAPDTGATYSTSSPPGFYMTDEAGRLWPAWVSTAPRALRPGASGRFTLSSVVPKALAGHVELVMWQNEHQGRNQSGPSLRFRR